MLFNKNKTKENMTMDEENKMVELTDEQLKQVSGGAFIDANRGIGCPNSNDCEGYLVNQCQFTYCPKGYK